MFKQLQDEPGGRVGLCIVSVAGTRPEAIKFAPLIIEAEKRAGVDHRLLATGQQDALFDDALGGFGLRADRKIGRGWQAGNRSSVMRAIAAELTRQRPDLVLVQGDTDSALMAAQAASRLHIPVGHVEAGLRTFDFASPFPEEQNRVAIAKLATLHFAPCQQAASNLERENVGGSIFVTGNSGIDALMMQLQGRKPAQRAGPILVTCHRRENFGPPLERICSALAQLAGQGLRFTVALHTNPNSAEAIRTLLSACPGIDLIPPLSYGELIARVSNAPFVLSDSGGLQEECAAMGVPLLLLRDNTERPEVVESGNCRLVGSDPARIVEAALKLSSCPHTLDTMSRPAFPYGLGAASAKILDAIGSWHAAKRIETPPIRTNLFLQ